jgi:hypothetical protein
VGGVSERPTRARERSNLLFELVVAAVEGTLIHRMPAAFAGCRRSVGLGRSALRRQWVSPPVRERTGDSGCPLECEEGNVVGVRQSARTRNGRREKARSPSSEDTSFARSRDPCTSIATALSHRKVEEVARPSGYRGRANLRKQEEPAPGLRRTDECTARRVAPLFEVRRKPRQKEVVRVTSEPEGDCGLRPSEETRVRVGLLVRRSETLQKSAGGVWSRISPHAALQKEWRCRLTEA